MRLQPSIDPTVVSSFKVETYQGFVIRATPYQSDHLKVSRQIAQIELRDFDVKMKQHLMRAALYLLAAIALCILYAACADAQELTLNSTVKYLGATTTSTTQLGMRIGEKALICLDPAGAILLGNPSVGTISRITPLLGPPVIVMAGIPNMTAIGCDPHGNVYASSSTLDYLTLEDAATGLITRIGSGVSGVTSITFDQAGNVVVADTANNRILSINPAGIATTRLNVQSPTAVYVDPDNDLYVGSPSGITAYWFNGQVYSIGKGWSQPTSITQSGTADLEVVDSGLHELIHYVSSSGAMEIIAGGGDPRSISSVSGSSTGDLYGYDVNKAQVLKLDAQINLGNNAIGATSTTYTLAYLFLQKSTLGTIAALTQGYADKQLAIGDGSCLVDFAYVTGDTCTIEVAAKLNASGPWNGDLSVLDTNGVDLLDIQIFASGVGPVQVLLPGRAETYFEDPYSYTGELIASALTTDVAGNLYIGDDGNACVLKVESDGNTSELLSDLEGDILALTVDGKGNLFVAEQALALGISPNLGAPSSLTSNTFTAIRYGQWGYANSFVSNMTGLLVKKDGGYFFSDSQNDRVISVDPNGEGTEVALVSSSIGESGAGLNYPLNLAYASDGSLLIVDYGNNRIVKRTTSGVLSEVFPPGTLLAGQSIEAPMGLAVDPAGNLYIADTGNNRIVGLTPQGKSWVILDSHADIDGTNAIPLNNPQTITLDSQGNLFVADVGNNRVIKIDRSTQNVIFPETNVGAESTSIPAIIQNIGNQTLSLGSITVASPSLGFIIDPATSCSSGLSLQIDSTCTLEFDFLPTSVGDAVDVALVASNSQRIPGSSAVVHLEGIAQLASTPVVVNQLNISSLPNTITAGSPFSYILRAQDIEGNLVTGYRGTVHISWSDGRTQPIQYTFLSSDAGSHTFNGVALTLAGVDTLTVADAAVTGLAAMASTTVYAATAAKTIMISGSDQTALIGQAFQKPLVVGVQDAFGNLVPGVTVLFQAPINGPSAVAATGGNSVSSFSDSTGLSYADVVANAVVGSYEVVALAGSTKVGASFFLSNVGSTIIPQAGSFTMTAIPPVTAFNSSGIASSSLAFKLIDGFTGNISLTCKATETTSCVLSSSSIIVPVGPLDPIAAITITIKQLPYGEAVVAKRAFAQPAVLGLTLFCWLVSAKKRKQFYRRYLVASLALYFCSTGLLIGCGAPILSNTAPGTTSKTSTPITIFVTAEGVATSKAKLPSQTISIVVDPYHKADLKSSSASRNESSLRGSPRTGPALNP